MGVRLTRDGVQGRLAGIDTSVPAGDRSRMERALREYLDALGLEDGWIRFAGDLAEARTRFFEKPGRWPTFSARQARLGGRQARGSVGRELAGAESHLEWILVGHGKIAASVRTASQLALQLPLADEREPTARRACALDAILAAAEAGAMAWWPEPGGIVAVPRPAMTFEAGVLHRWDGGPAVRWANGRELYFWHGVHVTERTGQNPDRLTAAWIDRTQNAERRRVMLERLGYERYLEGIGAKLRAQDRYGRLWVGTVRDEDEVLCVVDVENATAEPDGSRRRYFLRVPPETRAAREAVAWTFGFEEPRDYRVAFET